jgi:hypothetical protein
LLQRSASASASVIFPWSGLSDLAPLSQRRMPFHHAIRPGQQKLLALWESAPRSVKDASGYPLDCVRANEFVVNQVHRSGRRYRHHPPGASRYTCFAPFPMRCYVCLEQRVVGEQYKALRSRIVTASPTSRGRLTPLRRAPPLTAPSTFVYKPPTLACLPCTASALA